LEEIRQTFTEDHQFKYGTPNPSLPPTKVACGGCGALLHARQARFIFNGVADQDPHRPTPLYWKRIRSYSRLTYVFYDLFTLHLHLNYHTDTGRFVKKVIDINKVISCRHFKHYLYYMKCCGSGTALIDIDLALLDPDPY
jgi:hypothetical protein